MHAMKRDETPVVLADGGLEVRIEEIGGGQSVGFFHLPEGTDLAPALAGLPDDMCQCPHWGYLLKGRLLMRFQGGETVYEEGQAFYWGPGHVPVALTDTDYVDFSPSEGIKQVIDHVKGGAG